MILTHNGPFIHNRADVIYKLRKILGHVHFESLFNKRIKSFIKKDYDPAILQRTSRLAIDCRWIDNQTWSALQYNWVIILFDEWFNAFVKKIFKMSMPKYLTKFVNHVSIKLWMWTTLSQYNLLKKLELFRTNTVSVNCLDNKMKLIH